MGGKMSRNKGAAGEREFAAQLRDLFGVDAHRGRQYHGGPEAPDVVCEIEGIHWEVKRTEGLSLYPALEQSKGDCDWGEVPVVAHRRNRKPWVVCCYFDDLLELVEKLSDFGRD
ncbi:MAG: PDDEXK family nuclease [Candidatus Methanospirareceae archaeon]